MKKIFRIIIFLLILSTILIATGSVFAATKEVKVGGDKGYTLLEPGILGSNPTAPKDFLAYVNVLYQSLLYISIALAIIYIVIGGFEYLTSAAASGKGDGKKKVTDALIGLAIALLSFLILKTINPDLVQWKLCIPKLPATSCAPTK